MTAPVHAAITLFFSGTFLPLPFRSDGVCSSGDRSEPEWSGIDSESEFASTLILARSHRLSPRGWVASLVRPRFDCVRRETKSKTRISFSLSRRRKFQRVSLIVLQALRNSPLIVDAVVSFQCEACNDTLSVFPTFFLISPPPSLERTLTLPNTIVRNLNSMPTLSAAATLVIPVRIFFPPSFPLFLTETSYRD